MTGHYSLDELSDWTSDGLDASRSAAVAEHVAACAECADRVQALDDVRRTLAGATTPPMPVEVFGRLAGVVAAESERRTARQRPHPLLTAPRPTLGALDSRLPRTGRSRRVGLVLASIGVAAAMAFGGYVLSATAGLNEPATSSPLTVSAATLAVQANGVRQRQNLTPHRFSNAWQCGREVTAGRITGIWAITLGGQPGFMIYLAEPGGTRVTVVRGCDTDAPVAGPTAFLPDR